MEHECWGGVGRVLGKLLEVKQLFLYLRGSVSYVVVFETPNICHIYIFISFL